MSPPDKPSPPKSCPVCRVAMQATAGEAGVVHSCQRCGVTLTVRMPLSKSARAADPA